MRFFTILTAFALTAATTALAADSPLIAARAGSGLPNQHMRMHRRVVKAQQLQQQQRSNAAAASPFVVPASSNRRRATQEQLDAAAQAKAQNDIFHAQNAAWQAAAMESLKAGKTPLDFDSFVASQGGQTTSPAADETTADVDDEDVDAEDDADDDVDEDDDAEDDDAEDDEDDDEDVTPTGEEIAVSAKHASKGTVSDAQTKPGSKSTGVSPPKKTAGKKQKDNKGKGNNGNNGNNNGGSSDSGSSGNGEALSGEGTWYNMAGGYTACGQMYSDSDMVVALSHSLFDTKTPNGNPNNNGFCGKKLRATYQGKSITVTAVDRCAGCAYGDLDFTPAAFSQLASVDVGRLSGVTWHWL